MYKFEEPLNSADFYFQEVEHLKLKGAGKRLKEKAKEAGKKIGTKIKDAAKKLNPSDALWLPLVPFKLAMKKALDKKGIKTGNKLPEIATAFAKNVVGKQNLEDEPTAGDKLTDVAGQVQQVGGVVGSAAGIVKIIISFFKKNDKKIKDGEGTADDMELKLDSEEGLDAADESTPDQLADEAKGSETGRTRERAGETSTGAVDQKTMLYLVLLVAVVYFVSKK